MARYCRSICGLFLDTTGTYFHLCLESMTVHIVINNCINYIFNMMYIPVLVCNAIAWLTYCMSHTPWYCPRTVCQTRQTSQTFLHIYDILNNHHLIQFRTRWCIRGRVELTLDVCCSLSTSLSHPNHKISICQLFWQASKHWPPYCLQVAIGQIKSDAKAESGNLADGFKVNWGQIQNCR